MSSSLSTPFIGGVLASIINLITTESPPHLPPYTAIYITGDFISVCEGENTSSKIEKQVTSLCLNLQYIQQRCCSFIGNAKDYFCLKKKVYCQK